MGHILDTVSREKRSQIMRAVGRINTAPELRVRRVAHALGLRFRLYRKDLAGSPDLVFPRHRVAVFVHGCFWHRHAGCKKASTPKSNQNFWLKKFSRNTQRDSDNEQTLIRHGWKVIVVWECETENSDLLRILLNNYFNIPKQTK